MILQQDFYQREDVCSVARDLIGKVIVTKYNGRYTSGVIVETEAYAGVTDKASHAYGGRRTLRTEVMYANGGVAYVYLCYGIHHLFNVVTNTKDVPHAVLIRAIEPLEGIDIMLKRRKKKALTPTLTAGPGSMSMALGITTKDTGVLLNESIVIVDRGLKVRKSDIIEATRVGVAYAEEDALLPYRYLLKGNPYISKGKGL